MKSSDVRRSFIEYFAARGHAHRPSAPLVPHGDATLLFTNAGMVQFKDYFLGLDEPAFSRAVTAQKCMRVSGKHNDLENVGPSPRHHTFFEMLGNFSFGDYFKAEAVEFAWELVTEVWGLPPARLYATVFEEDDEAEVLWRKVSGLAPERVLRCGKKDNFWAMGDTGPCGPCSEIFVDLEPELPAVDWQAGTDSGRYLEIWNLVFMQFDAAADGTLTPLPNPSIDTGAGLERVAAVLQGVDSNYDSDLFRPLVDAASALAGKAYGASQGDDVSTRVIADHLRAVAFLLADGVIPSNEGRGYVLRRILRRAVRHGMNLGFDEPFLHRLLPVVGEVLGAAYPELGATRAASAETVAAEEAKFLSTVATASQQVQGAIDRARREGASTLDGETVFRFYDTFGLPVELIREIAEEERFAIDEKGFASALESQRVRSREAGAGGKDRLEAARRAVAGGGAPAATVYRGQKVTATSDEPLEVVAVARRDGEAFSAGTQLGEGEAGVVLLAETVFYAEAGGQVGDRGELTWEGGRARVRDTQKDTAGVYYHFVEVEEGSLAAGAAVAARVDPAHRLPTQRNHTATHLLHAALRHVLGEGVRQAGSLVAPERLRFDFTYGHPVGADELAEIERIVNDWVLESRPVTATETSYREAVEAGAMALFGEKYGERVRTIAVQGGVGSLELCGGCHVASTGEIGPVLLLGERGVASGVRRIEALSGEAALAEIRRRAGLLDEAASEIGAEPERLATEIRALKVRARELEKELSQARMKLVSGAAPEKESVEVAGVEVLAREVPPAPANELRSMADVLRGKLGSGVVILGSRGDGKVSLVVAVSADLTERLSAGDLVGRLAPMVGGGGGGRRDFAQAGGREPQRLEAALAAAPDLVRDLLH